MICAKPKGCTHPNCYICPLPDCRYNGGYEQDREACCFSKFKKQAMEFVYKPEIKIKRRRVKANG